MTDQVDNETIKDLVLHLRTLADEIERRGVIVESIKFSGSNEVIRHPGEHGVMMARQGPKIRRSFTFAWADVEPASEIAGERSIWHELPS